MVPAVWAMLTTGVTALFRVSVIAELTAVEVLAQDELLVRIQLISSPFNNAEELNDELLVPALLPFTCHW